MLFNLYIEYIKEIFDDCSDPIFLHDDKINHFLYANDLVLVSHSDQDLQRCPDKLVHYTGHKHLTVNVKKSKTMIFNPLGKHIKEVFNINKKKP